MERFRKTRDPWRLDGLPGTRVQSLRARRRVFNYLKAAEARGDYSPTYREIGSALRMPLATVRYHLVRLRAAGLIDFEPARARTIVVLKKGA